MGGVDMARRMTLSEVIAVLKAAERDQCGCLGTGLAHAIGELEGELMERGYVAVRPGRDRPWTVGDQVDIYSPGNVRPSKSGP